MLSIVEVKTINIVAIIPKYDIIILCFRYKNKMMIVEFYL